MPFQHDIERYEPVNEQERRDKELILIYIEQFPENILLRDNRMAHITSSGFIFNKALTKVLMIHHNIYNTWAWTGGHADGNGNLLQVALQEAQEETGLRHIRPLSETMASLDILPVYGHFKNGHYVSTHLHLSVAYNFIADEGETLIVNEKETSGVQWISIDSIHEYSNEPELIYIYKKLIQKAKNTFPHPISK